MEREEPPHPYAYYSDGRWLLNQVYIVGWRELGIVKVGTTSNGREHYGPFLNRGGELISLTSYEGMSYLDIKRRVLEVMEICWPLAFESKAEAAEHLGRGGCGWLECYSIPVAEWYDVIDLVRTGD